jgi:hypothetical protein
MAITVCSGADDGIGHQIAKGVMQLGRIPADDLCARRHRDVDALMSLVERARHVGYDVVRQDENVAVDDIESLLTGVQPGEPQEILDEPLHPLGMARDNRQEPAALLGVAVAVGQGLDVSADCR